MRRRGSIHWLEASEALGERLANAVRFYGGHYVWQIVRPGSRRSGDSRYVPANCGLYQGTAGIGLFLAELAARTGRQDLGSLALSIMEDACQRVEELPGRAFGLFTGRSGVAYAAARTAQLCNEPTLLAQAVNVARQAMSESERATTYDLLGGIAGQIPVLLYLAHLCRRPELGRSAIRLGSQLIAAARMRARGWSWGPEQPSLQTRDLTGMAHGAAGIAHVLLQLYAATGMRRFRYAAVQGFEYERQWFNKKHKNWPDFRYHAIGSVLRGDHIHVPEDLVSRLADGASLPQCGLSYPVAWCHGAAGIALSRLHAYSVLKDPIYRREAVAALQTVCRRVQKPEYDDWSLCHGRSGCCDALITGSTLLGDNEWRHAAERAMGGAVGRFEGGARRWPCGTVGGLSDPSLMLGEAGIGYTLLRLASHSVSSILVSRQATSAKEVQGDEEHVSTLRRRHLSCFFDRTLRAIDRFDGAARYSAISDARSLSDLCIRIRARIANEANGKRRKQLEDVFSGEMVRYSVSKRGVYVVPAAGSMLLREALRRGVLEKVRLRWDRQVRIVSFRWDWDEWLDGPNGGLGDGPALGPVQYVIYPWKNGLAEQRIGGVNSAIMEHFRSYGTLKSAIQEIESLELHLGDVENVRDVVKETVARAYIGGVLVPV